MDSTRDEYIDFLKGSTILLVIVGHVLQGPIDENLLRYFIYYFHMPFMFALSGFVLREYHFHTSIKPLVKKYWHRMLLPWLLASIFYTVFFALPKAQESEIIVSHLIYLVLHPWYHLWYIPSLFIMVLVMKFIYKQRIWLVMPFACIMSIASLAFLDNQVSIEKIGIKFWLGNRGTYDYIFFFVLGVFLRKQKDNSKSPIRLSKLMLGIIFLILMAIGMIDFRQNFHPIVSAATQLATNTIIILFAFNSRINTDLFRMKKIVAFMGRISLPIYLWHIFPIIVCDKLIKNRIIFIQDKISTILYYSVVMLFIAIMLWTLVILEKKQTPLTRRALFGS